MSVTLLTQRGRRQQYRLEGVLELRRKATPLNGAAGLVAYPQPPVSEDRAPLKRQSSAAAVATDFGAPGVLVGDRVDRLLTREVPAVGRKHDALRCLAKDAREFHANTLK